jgi:GDPmannose 4,6-dehydratase
MLKFPDTHKITPLELGNLNARRDWTDAEDCVDAVWRMMNQDRWNILWLPTNPSTIEWTSDTKSLSKYIVEYVVSSGENHTVKEFVEEAFEAANIQGHWEGKEEKERFIWDTLSWPDDVLVQINPTFYRPAEVDHLLGDPTRIKEELGWKPTTTFKQLVKKMVDKDLMVYGL